MNGTAGRSQHRAFRSVSKHFEARQIGMKRPARGRLVVAARYILLRINATCCVCVDPSSYPRHGQGHRQASQGIRRDLAGTVVTNPFRAGGDASPSVFS
jgi:hypothetical protein